MPPSLPMYLLAPAWQPAFWGTYTAWFVSEMWIFIRDLRRVHGANQDQGSRRLIVAVFYVGIIAAFWLSYATPAARMPGPPGLLMATGIGLMWAGMAFRLWAVVTLGRFFRTKVVVQDDHRLVTAGPYRVVRNPAYTGGLVTLIGLGVALGDWYSLACTLGAGLIGYLWRIRVEEAALSARFGEAWEQYKRGSWALVPLIW